MSQLWKNPVRARLGSAAVRFAGAIFVALLAGCADGASFSVTEAPSDAADNGATPASGGALAVPPRLDPLLGLLSGGLAGVDDLKDVVPIRTDAAGVRVQVLVERLAGGTVDWNALGASEVRGYGEIFTAWVPAANLPRLSAAAAVRRVRAARFLHPLLDLSVPASGADRGISLPSPGPAQGTGAVVGIVDTGVDYKHPDFQAGGVNRIISSWDQGTGLITNPATGGAGHCDSNGHGTHVASTAAGNGNADPGSAQIGVAAGAPIVAVKTTFSDADIVAGVEHVFTVAAGLGKPAVVNLSLGGHFGPHDGTDPFDLAMDALSGPGKIVIAAAGNEGLDRIHAGGDVTTTATAFGAGMTIEYDHVSSSTYAYVDIYYNAKQELNVWLRHENGTIVSPTALPQGFQICDNSMLGCPNYVIQHLPADPVNGKANIFVRTRSRASGSQPHKWQVIVAKKLAAHPAMRFDGWVAYSSDSAAVFTTAGTFAGNSISTIGTPATAKSAISVAAYVTRNGGGYGNVPQIAGFSSRGPTADGRAVDIAAPGSVIMAAKTSYNAASDSCPGFPGGSALPVDSETPADTASGPGFAPLAINATLYQGLQGTSMATPHVTGLVALMLQKDPALSPAGVRMLLAETARFDGDETGIPGVLPDNTWGFGKATAGPKGASVGVLAATDIKLPRLGASSLRPAAASVGAGTTITVSPGTFSPRNAGAARRFRVRWQRQRIAADCNSDPQCLINVGDFFNIAGAVHRTLAPAMFAAADVLRPVLTPVELDPGYRAGYFMGADAVGVSFTAGADSTPRSHASEVGWNLLAVPAQGSATDSLLAGFTDAKLWRWSEAAQAYQAITNTGANDLVVGQGLFAEVSDLAIQGALVTTDALPSQSTDVTLSGLSFTAAGSHPGRHLIGNPFNKRIYWQNLQVRAAGGSTWIGVTEAAASALIQPVYYGDYANQEGQYLMNTAGGLDGVIDPWRAVWIVVKQPVDLRIPASQSAPNGPANLGGSSYPMRLSSEVAGGGLPAGETGSVVAGNPLVASGLPAGFPPMWKQKLADLSSRLQPLPAWTLQLSASSGPLRDDFNFLGVHKDASDNYDGQDYFDAGTLGSAYVQLYVDRSLRPGSSSVRGRFCQDIQKLERGKTRSWPVVVKTDGLGKPVTLTWGLLPTGWTLSLLDDTSGTAVDMGSRQRYEFVPAVGAQSRQLLIAATAPQ